MIIPFSKPSIGEEEKRAVCEVLDSGWLSIGKKVQEFEEKVAEYLGVKHAIATNSCTSALFLSAQALSDIHGVCTSEVPALTFVATANAMDLAQMDIRFNDVDSKMLMIPSDRVNDFTVAVPVHFAGNPVDTAKYKNKFIIEDAAHAFGGKYLDGKMIGNSDSLVCFSFYPTKNMTTGEGGMVTTNNTDLAEWIRSLTVHGLEKDHITRYSSTSTSYPIARVPGYKMHMDNIQAAIGIEQLKKLPDMLYRREEIAYRYLSELFSEVKFPTYHRSCFHLFVILVDNRDTVLGKLRDSGVMAGVHYYPIIPEHPAYKHSGGFKNAREFSKKCISLPIYPSMTDKEVEYVIEKVKESL